MFNLSRAAALALALLAACSDDGHDTGRPSTTTGPNLTVCTDCPVNRMCPEGQVCASYFAGSGSVCMLACSESDPESCMYEGLLTGTCTKFGKTWACSDPNNGPVCPPSK